MSFEFLSPTATEAIARSPMERQARAAGARDPRQLAFEIYSVGLGANASHRLLADGQAFDRARAAIERLLAD